MTEEDWWKCIDARAMLVCGLLRTSPRKLRLFAVACCRACPRLLSDPSHRRDIDLAERFADGAASQQELEAAHLRVNSLACRLNVGDMTEADICQMADVTAVANVISPSGDPASDAVWQLRRAGHDVDREMVAILHDVFGNPFRPVGFDPPAWFGPFLAKVGESAHQMLGELNPAWRTPTVVALASQMYQSRDFSTMPILADALQETGCDNEDLLNHCHAPGPHVRGCWVVDWVLKKG
jgi:hypothetical protein